GGVEESRRREERSRMGGATEIRQRDDGDERDGELHLVPAKRRDGRRDRGDPGRDRYRDGQRVVDEQRRGRHQRRVGAKVLATDDVGPAAVRIGVQGLAVAGDDDHEQRNDEERDRDQVAERGHARGRDEDNEDLLGREGGRRDRVGREDPQREPLRQSLVLELPRRQWAPDQQPLERAISHVASSSRRGPY